MQLAKYLHTKILLYNSFAYALKQIPLVTIHVYTNLIYKKSIRLI